ncbi:MAG: aminotransferase class I/II-fold pyridoxal phosphate-dependent enzyme [Candidatus Synoicihabitans palmerolidicus]|nr:aminotransferase class I/II-fold pyridoxal phosphate-dependent enzyme [Candidatus Synoicihabitans palmerolidicus]
MFSVGLPPPQAAAALAALRNLVAEPERVNQLRERSEWLRDALGALGLDTGTSGESAVVPWVVGDSQRALELAMRLRMQRIQVHPIIAPAVDERGARLRFFVTSEHRFEDLADTVAAVRRVIGANCNDD